MTRLLIIALAALLVACGGAERKEEHRTKAAAFFEQGDYEKARLEYKNVVLIDPKDLEGHLQLARVQEKLGNLPTAVGEYRNVLTLDETHIPAKVGLGYLFAMAGMEDAAQYADEILAAEADHVDGLVIRAMVAARSGRLSDAMADANRALSLDDKHVRAGILLSNLYLQAEQPEDAANAINSLLSLYPDDLQLLNQQARLMWNQSKYAETIAALEKTVELQPENLAQYAFLSGVQLKQGSKGAAEETLHKAVAAMPDKVEPKLMLVDFLLKEQGPERAEQQLLQFVDGDRNPDLKLTLATLYQRTGQLKKAEASYRSIIDDDDSVPAVLKAKNKLALIALGQSRKDEADSLLGEVLDESSKDQEALTLRGKLRLSSGDVDRAINDFRAVLKQAPESVEIRRLLAQAQRQAGNNELALLNLQKAVEVEPQNTQLKIDTARLLVEMERTGHARQMLDDILRQDPGNEMASRALVALQLKDKDEKGALSTLRTLQEKKPESAFGHYLEGRLHQAKQDFQKSNASLERALVKQPGAIEPLVSLVTNYLYEKNIVGARRVLNRALDANPGHVVAKNLLGEIELASGGLQKAETLFKSAVKIKPDWWIPYRNLASLKWRQGNRNEAVQVMKRALEANPDSARIGLELALLQASAGQRTAAINSYESLIAQHPDSVAAKNNLAMLLADDDGSSADRRRALELAKQLPEKNPLLMDTKAWVLFRNGEKAEAKQLMQKALEALDESPDLHFHYGLILESAGEGVKALEHLRRAIELGTAGVFADLDKARSAVKRIESL